MSVHNENWFRIDRNLRNSLKDGEFDMNLTIVSIPRTLDNWLCMRDSNQTLARHERDGNVRDKFPSPMVAVLFALQVVQNTSSPQSILYASYKNS